MCSIRGYCNEGINVLLCCHGYSHCQEKGLVLSRVQPLHNQLTRYQLCTNIPVITVKGLPQAPSMNQILCTHH